jgi:protein-S-isoprenylcysteine O-methyltransferase Ste14
MSTAKAPNGSRRWSGGNISLTARNVLFSLVVPGLGAVLVPWWILDGARAAPLGPAWLGVIPVAAGLVLYLACVRVFAAVGRGTPGPWDAPRQVVAVGPYGWVRNPIYLAALLVVLGETCIFQSGALLGYAAAMAVGFHLFVVGYEEPHLRRAFGTAYIDYSRRVHRWLPRPRERPGLRTRQWTKGEGPFWLRDTHAGPAPAQRTTSTPTPTSEDR